MKEDLQDTIQIYLVITMRSAVVFSFVALGLAAPFNARAQVDPGIHKLCVEAKDYAGCVKAMKGDTSPTGGRVVNSQGADIAEGNQCTAGFAYTGGGNCQNVQCFYPSSDLGHDQLIAGKKTLKARTSGAANTTGLGAQES